MPYPRHSLKEPYPSEEIQSVYSTAPADWAKVPQALGNDPRLLDERVGTA